MAKTITRNSNTSVDTQVQAKKIQIIFLVNPFLMKYMYCTN